MHRLSGLPRLTRPSLTPPSESGALPPGSTAPVPAAPSQAPFGMRHCLGEGLPTRQNPQNQGMGLTRLFGLNMSHVACAGVWQDGWGEGRSVSGGKEEMHLVERSPGLFVEQQEAHRPKAEAGRSVAASGASGALEGS